MGWQKHQLLQEAKRNQNLALGRKTDVFAVAEAMVSCETLACAGFALENWPMKACCPELESLVGKKIWIQFQT